jgi:hypothetical protein
MVHRGKTSSKTSLLWTNGFMLIYEVTEPFVQKKCEEFTNATEEGNASVVVYFSSGTFPLVNWRYNANALALGYNTRL